MLSLLTDSSCYTNLSKHCHCCRPAPKDSEISSASKYIRQSISRYEHNFKGNYRNLAYIKCSIEFKRNRRSQQPCWSTEPITDQVVVVVAAEVHEFPFT